MHAPLILSAAATAIANLAGPHMHSAEYTRERGLHIHLCWLSDMILVVRLYGYMQCNKHLRTVVDCAGGAAASVQLTVCAAASTDSRIP